MADPDNDKKLLREMLAELDWQRRFGGCSMASHIGKWRDKRFKQILDGEN